MSEEQRKIQLIMALRNKGVRDTKVLDAMERIPREAFLAEGFAASAYADHSLPIECGQTISQPYIVAFMTEQLKLTDRTKILEIGTGSGYQTAILSLICRRVYTVERYRTLHRQAEARFAALKLGNITAMAADGARGWPAQAPFERIIVTAAAAAVPPTLVEQLTIGGLMIVPVELAPGRQELQRITRTEDSYEAEPLLPVRFVPLIEGMAREL